MSVLISSTSTAARRGSGVPLLVLAGIAWGTGGLLGSLLGRETGLSPLAVAAYRLGLGGLLVLIAVAAIALIEPQVTVHSSVRPATVVPPCAASGCWPCWPPRSRRATSRPSR